jgi:outer membrane protein
MNKVVPLLLFILLIQAPVVRGQEYISLQQAIEIALKNNYSIQISKNQDDIAKNDNSLGNAGMLPLVSIGAAGSVSNNNTQQHYASGLEVNKNGVTSNTFNAGPQVNWILFDGMKMFATHDKLKELQDMGDLNLKIMIENTVAKIISAYFDIARQKQLLNALNEAISIYQERLSIAETKSRIGNGSDADVLQAKVDLNEQKSAEMRQKVLISNSKTILNVLLSRDSYSVFDIKDSIVITYQPKFEELKSTVIKQNNSLLIAQKNVSVSNYALKEIGAQRYPILAVNAGYNFSRSENSAGFILLNQNLGYTAGFSINWNLFNGLNVNRQIRDAQLNSMNYELLFKDTRNQVESALLIAFTNFQNAIELLHLEEDNITLAKKNVEINLERFRLGYVTSLQLKDAQKSFLDAESRLVAARYDAKVSETELMRLNGALVK